jgi:hypothetical protein
MLTCFVFAPSVLSAVETSQEAKIAAASYPSPEDTVTPAAADEPSVDLTQSERVTYKKSAHSGFIQFFVYPLALANVAGFCFAAALIFSHAR